jgi:hypothetical protein
MGYETTIQKGDPNKTPSQDKLPFALQKIEKIEKRQVLARK